MKAIILAAGRGSRMGELTRDKPKCLVEIHGKPLLELQLAAIQSSGIDKSNIAIVSGYKNESLSKYKLKEFHNSRWENTNMVSSLSCASSWLNNEPCIVSYSDIFYESLAVKLLMDCTATIAITFDTKWQLLWEKRFENPLSDAETFCLKNNNILSGIGKKAKTMEEIEGQYMGVLRFEPRGWSEVTRIRAIMTDSECDQMDMTGLLQKIIEQKNIQIQAIAYDKSWGEVDSLEDLEVYEKEVLV
jgi:choline kinase